MALTGLLAGIGSVAGGLGSIFGASNQAKQLKRALEEQKREWNEAMTFQRQQRGAVTPEFRQGTPVSLPWYTGSFEPQQFQFAKTVWEALKRSPQEMREGALRVTGKFAPALDQMAQAMTTGGLNERLAWLAPVAQQRQALAQTYVPAIQEALESEMAAARARNAALGYGQTGTPLAKQLAGMRYGAYTQQAQALGQAMLENALAEAAAREAAYNQRLQLSGQAPALAQQFALMDVLPAATATQELGQLYQLFQPFRVNQSFSGVTPIDTSRFVGPSVAGTAFGALGGVLGGVAQSMQQAEEQRKLFDLLEKIYTQNQS